MVIHLVNVNNCVHRTKQPLKRISTLLYPYKTSIFCYFCTSFSPCGDECHFFNPESILGTSACQVD